MALVGHGEGPAQAALALDELDDVGIVRVQDDQVADVAHGAHEGHVPRRALEGVVFDAVLGRAFRHNNVVDSIQLLQGLLYCQRRRRGPSTDVHGPHGWREVHTTLELECESAPHRVTVTDDVHRLHVGHKLHVARHDDDLRLRHALLDAGDPGV